LPAGGDTAAPINLQKRLNVLRRHVDVRRGRLLDCGCGGGDYVLGLLGMGADAWGIEYSAEKIARRQLAVSRRLAVGDLQDIPLLDGSIDIALLNEVLEHVPDDRRAMRQVFDALKPGGMVVVFSPNRLYPFETHGTFLKGSSRRLPHYVPFVPYVPLSIGTRLLDYWARNYWPRELRRLITDAGFVITAVDFVWQTFEAISGHQPRFIARAIPLLRRIASTCERVPLVRTFGASQVIVARKPLR
jgi:SAM-dependent methyltransferase